MVTSTLLQSQKKHKYLIIFYLFPCKTIPGPYSNTYLSSSVSSRVSFGVTGLSVAAKKGTCTACCPGVECTRPIHVYEQQMTYAYFIHSANKDYNLYCKNTNII